MAAEKCFLNHPSCCLLPDHLRYIADRCVKDWRRLLSELSVADHIIDTISADADSANYINDSREIAYQGLRKWQQIDPKKAALCVLVGALDKAGRNDIKDGLQQVYGLTFHSVHHLSLGKTNSIPSLVDHFVGRDAEIHKIVRFCHTDSPLRLMLLIGLPGIGKTELLNNSLQKIVSCNQKLNIVRPLFPANGMETRWGLEDIAVSILEELHPNMFVSKHRVAVLHKTLTSIKEPTLLILEIANLDFKQDALILFWSFIDRLLRYENDKLKVIVTSSKNPDLNQMQNLKIDDLVLKELDSVNAAILLKRMNPRLSDEDCSKISRFCGGNPFILRKLGAHIQNFASFDDELKKLMQTLETNFENDLQPFIRQTVLKRDMRIVFNDLEVDEQETLVKLCCFREIIPLDMINNLFGNDSIRIADHLWHNHCILDRGRCGTYYRMNELTRTFIIDYAQSNDELRNVLLDAKVALIRYYNILLRELDDLFFCPTKRVNDVCWNVILNYRSECKSCPQYSCSCVLPHVTQVIFQNAKTSIMQSIKSGLKVELVFYETVDVCLHAVHFLRNVLTSVELTQLYDLIFEKLNQRCDRVRMAITIANLVFVKIYHKVREEQDQNIAYLTKSIDFLEKNRLQINVDVLTTLAFCYINRGYLRGFYKNQFEKGKRDIEKAQQILQYMPKNSKLPVAELSTYGYMGAVYYRNQMLKESMHERDIQIQGYKRELGIHPYTAKSLHYQAQGYAKLKEYSKALTCCVLSYQMYLKLKGEGLETMRVLSTHGKILVNKGFNTSGVKKLEHALRAAENVLGEHDKVAACIDQLADANSKLLGAELTVEKLRRKSSAMREQFDLNTLSATRKTYSLQLSFDDTSKFNFMKTKEEDHYFRFAFLMMFIAILWNLIVFFYQKPSCDTK